MKRFLIFMALAIQSSAALASSLVLDSFLPQDLKKGKFKITLNIVGVNAEEVGRGRSDPTNDIEQLKNRINIYLPDVNPLVPLPVGVEGLKEEASLFTFREIRKHTETGHSDGTRSYMYFLEVNERTAGTLAAKATKGKLKVSAFFYLGGTSIANLVAKTENITIGTEEPLQDSLPPQIGISSAQGRLDFLWTVDNTEPNQTVPTDLNIILIQDSLAKTLTLPAFKISRIPGLPDSSTSCSYSGSVGFCLSCPGDYYLDIDALADIKGVTVIKAKTLDGFASSAKLDAGKYFMTGQYSPKGIVQTECEQAFVY